ncbi:MAG: NAD+ synthase [Actinomycetota bacterium]|nr:NAD+ synthase [Actinomycetota bacterium]
MPQLRVALGQVNPTVGAIDANTAQVVDTVRQAAQQGAHLVALPEMVVTGYPIEDMALRKSFVEASREAVAGLATQLADEGFGDLAVVVGYLDRAGDATDRLGLPKGSPQNAAAVIHDGSVVARYAKHHLPNYGVFDEFRYFVPGHDSLVARVHGVDVAIAICEDLWQDGPSAAAKAAGAGLLLVLNGSPYEADKDDVRGELCSRRAMEAGCPLAYVNMVGGQDELVFDGDSLVVGADGRIMARAAQFEEALLVVDLDLAEATDAAQPSYQHFTINRVDLRQPTVEPYDARKPTTAAWLEDEAEIYGALGLGLRDYVRKNGFSSVVFGLSGGIDSALTAVIAADAIGAENVHCLSMPSRYSSDHSQDDARALAERVGVDFRVYEIEPMVQEFLSAVKLTGLAEENLQARVRGVIVMGLSNEEGHLVLATGNKSELAVGYSTMYGDSVGGYAPLKDVPKTLVWRLAEWRNEAALERGEVPPIPENSITKPPSAELRPGQQDSDSLPDYALLDDMLDDYVEHDRSAAELVAQGFEAALVDKVIQLVDRAEYKRRQYPPGPKISTRNFGRDRRLPITNAWRETR